MPSTFRARIFYCPVCSLNIRIDITVSGNMLPVVLFGCENWSVPLRNGHTLRGVRGLGAKKDI
jgi:hypothetical protein